MRPVQAGAGARVIAFAADYLLISIYLVALIALGSFALRYVPSVTQALFGSPVTAQVSGFALITLPVTLYFALFESSARQASWGKRRLGLRVLRQDGGTLSRTRAICRTLLKFVPWELSHGLIWRLYFAEAGSSGYSVGFTLVWLLVFANLLALWRSPSRQTLYDRLAGTIVVRSDEGSARSRRADRGVGQLA